MSILLDRYADVDSNWKLRKGKAELLRHYQGQVLTRNEAILAKCYECCGGYDDEKPVDCQITTCPLHQFMPYYEGKNRKVVSEAVKESARERLKQARKSTKESP